MLERGAGFRSRLTVTPMAPFAETTPAASASGAGHQGPLRPSLSTGERGRSSPSTSTPSTSVGPTAVPRPRGTRSGAASILVVEDEESYQEALLAGLTREGFDVELASDGADALERFADHPPDLVLLDLLLPRLSGIDVFRRMRAIAPVPVIIVSALSTETDIVLGLELGAEDYIAKPYRLRELVARIRSVLRRVSPPPHVPEREPESDSEPMQAVTVGPFRIDFSRRVVTAHGTPGPSVTPGVRSPGPAALSSRTSPDPRRADRPTVVGSRSCRYPDARYPHPQTAGEVGSRPDDADVLTDGARCGVSLRARQGRHDPTIGPMTVQAVHRASRRSLRVCVAPSVSPRAGHPHHRHRGSGPTDAGDVERSPDGSVVPDDQLGDRPTRTTSPLRPPGPPVAGRTP